MNIDPANAMKPNDFTGMDSIKRKWLERQALASPQRVVDCNIEKSLVLIECEGQLTPRRITQRYSRIMGYFRPVSSWNIGKQQEHAERVLFVERPLS